MPAVPPDPTTPSSISLAPRAPYPPPLPLTPHVTGQSLYARKGPWYDLAQTDHPGSDSSRAVTLSPPQDLTQTDSEQAQLQRCRTIRGTLIEAGLFAPTEEAGGARFRISPTPFPLMPEELAFFETLGDHLLAFYRALNHLYGESVRGTQPAWVAAYLDQGKPASLLEYARAKRWRDQVPAVIRPDVIPTADGMVITELDSVPGGIGLTAALGTAYTDAARISSLVARDSSQTPHASRVTCHEIVGGPDGMVAGFDAMLREATGAPSGAIAIVVSDEARDYRPEMRWMAARLRERGLDIACVEPRDLRFTEDALWLDGAQAPRRLALIYRFFELFDLPNIPKADLILYSAKGARVAMTPPVKPALEEKLAFALFHHPALHRFWRQTLGDESHHVLSRLFPQTWVLDPRPIPPAGVIPELALEGRALANFRDLADAGQKARRLVIKPSGFSELAWGSRGVSIGHDLSQSEWAAALDQALEAFATTPHVLQEFHKGRQFDLSYDDEACGTLVPMAGRARLSPYYFVTGGKAKLAGILATLCSLEKKVIHGMKDAIMAPCGMAVQNER